MYLGLNFLVRLRNGLSIHTSLRAISDAAKSAAFLGTFVGTFWYTICLTRTRLGPLFWPQSDQLFLENLCVKTSCLSCGWSILVEPAYRRLEMAFFVAPRALGTFVPRKYDRKVCGLDTLPQVPFFPLFLANLSIFCPTPHSISGKKLWHSQ